MPIRYAFCRIEPVQKLMNGIRAGLFHLHDAVDQS